MQAILRKIIQGLLLLFLLFLAVILIQVLVLPWLKNIPLIKSNHLLGSFDEKTTIINKTEQITVKEDFSVSKTSEKVLPSIVGIVTYSDIDQGGAAKPVIKSFSEFNDSIRTGLIVSGDGLIVTYGQSIKQGEKSEKYRVFLADGRQLEARILANDPYSNLTFFKVEANNLPVAPFSDSASLVNGEKLVLVGAAKDSNEKQFSLGLINARNKNLAFLNSELLSTEKSDYSIALQGQLGDLTMGSVAVDFNGAVAGIVGSRKGDDRESYFVVPVDLVSEVMRDLINDGSIERPVFGAYYLPVGDKFALVNNLNYNKGALIYSFSNQQGLAVIKNSAADKAGVLLGDIILEVDGVVIDRENPLSYVIANKKAGQEIKLKILRDGKELELLATLK